MQDLGAGVGQGQARAVPWARAGVALNHFGRGRGTLWGGVFGGAATAQGASLRAMARANVPQAGRFGTRSLPLPASARTLPRRMI